jgi:hypothetical protein
MQLQEDKCRPGCMQLKLMSQPCWGFSSFFQPRGSSLVIRGKSEPVLPLQSTSALFPGHEPSENPWENRRTDRVFREARASRICLCHVCVIMVGCCGHAVPRLRVACCRRLFLTESCCVLVWIVVIFGCPYPILVATVIPV